jgi:hypothetical protein
MLDSDSERRLKELSSARTKRTHQSRRVSSCSYIGLIQRASNGPLTVGADLFCGFFQPLQESIESLLVCPILPQSLSAPGIYGS